MPFACGGLRGSARTNGSTGLAGTPLATNLRALMPLVPLASARRARNEPELGTIGVPICPRGFRENMRKFNELSLRTTSGAPL